MSSQLPTKLGKEPLIDVVFECRFMASIPASDILPGVFYNHFNTSSGANIKSERLFASQLPEVLRNSDPNLKYSALLKIELEKFNILIGDQSIAISCKLPYPGWTAFKGHIVESISVLIQSKIVTGIERYSLKYVDIIPIEDLSQQVKSLDWLVKIGPHTLAKEVTGLRIEIPINDFLQIVSVQTGSAISFTNGEQKNGLVLDVDTIKVVSISSLEEFNNSMPALLESIHDANKEMFFRCLTKETITLLEPSYD